MADSGLEDIMKSSFLWYGTNAVGEEVPIEL